jgi:putative FmdB family regulatory protein
LKENKMPTYDFECEPCAYYTEIVQAHDAPSVQKCPHCGKKTLTKVYLTPPAIAIRGEPTTVGHLADRNTQKMGLYEKQDRDANSQVDFHTKQKETRERQRKINSMTPQQKLNWIKNGD